MALKMNSDIKAAALTLLKQLVAAGREFPDATHRVATTYQLSERALRKVVEAYDAEAVSAPAPKPIFFTTLELAVMTAIDRSEYGQTLTDEVWTFTLADNMPADGPRGKQISAIVASLVRKGALRCNGSGSNETVHMTDAGAYSYANARGHGTRKPFAGAS